MQTNYDVIIIGAGIQGVGIAQALALQGHQVLILEKNPSAGMETSSNSSKLIHGGLRYLETAQFHLVAECLKERALLLKNAPHLVKTVPFYIPVYRHSARSAIWIQLGLWLYQCLAKQFRFRSSKLKPSEYRTFKLKQQNLKAVFQYEDAQTDDNKLTLAVMNSAKRLGAHTLFINV